MDLSIVTTLYQSAPYLEDFYARITSAAEKITQDYEIVFVNDGSPDNSIEIVKGFFKKNKRVRIVDLSKNFGHHRAIMTGLNYVHGDLIFLIDCDLEEDPEILKDFHEKILNTGADVI